MNNKFNELYESLMIEGKLSWGAPVEDDAFNDMIDDFAIPSAKGVKSADIVIDGNKGKVYYYSDLSSSDSTNIIVVTTDKKDGELYIKKMSAKDALKKRDDIMKNKMSFKELEKLGFEF